MKRFLRGSICAFAAAMAVARPVAALEPPAYVDAEDSSYKWTEKKTHDLEGGARVTILRLTSQTWQGIKWRHWMHVVRPAEVKHPKQALLLVTGGKTSKTEPGGATPEVAVLRQVAIATGSVVVVVGQVPNQPLFDGLSEDALIAHTFQNFLETKDESWPALLPMTKAARRAMDAATEFVEKATGNRIEKWTVTGASKRGWTTWLTGAFDPRVEAIAPMVIDTLNIPKQMRLQVESFGEFSEEISDYTDLDLPTALQSPEGARLIQIVDPYEYREKLTMPKLIVLGTNDRYWPVDAVKLYFGDLPGEKHIHYVPNAGHGLGDGAVEAITAFYQGILAGEARPKYAWTTAVQNGASVTRVTATDTPLKVELWTAASADRDFRDDTWSGTPVEAEDGVWVARLQVPESGFAAGHVRLTFRSSLGHEYALCTNVEVVGAK